MLKKLLAALAFALAALVAAIGINTAHHGSRQLDVPPLPPVAINDDAAAARLAEGVRFRTVSSRADAGLNAEQFRAFQARLATQFPRVHATLKRESVGGLSLLYSWPGSDPGATPAMLLAHQDVVPIAPGTDADWDAPPFSGALRNGFVYGRGSWDDKGNLMAQLEAVEMLLAEGYRPKRTLYLAYGADEEVGGERGAAQISALLKSRGVRLDFVLDEGLLVLQGILPGIERPTALIGIAEKGYLNADIEISAPPGHSSLPPGPGQSAIAMLSATLKRLDDEQMPAAIRGVGREMFLTLAPEMALPQRIALSNLWLFGPLVQQRLERAASTNAMLRTTPALTVVNAGDKDNVLPGRAGATVNFRLLPGDTRADVVRHVHDKLAAPAERARVSVQPDAREASQVAATDAPQYRLLNRTIREVFPDALVAPGLMVAGTDSVHYDDLSDHVFKFSPIRAEPDDLKRFHGTNERLSVRAYADCIRFYRRLITQLDGAP